MAEITREKDPFKDILLKEYEYVGRLVIEDEQIGERRVEFFNTITTTVLTLLGALSGSGILLIGKAVDPKMFIIGTTVLSLFGIITLRRLIHRNITTDKNIKKRETTLKYFIKENEADKIKYLPFDPYSPKKPHHIDKGLRPLLSLRNGGLVENVMLINSLIFAGVALSVIALVPINLEYSTIFAYGLLGLGIFIGSWLLQGNYVRNEYYKEAKNIG